MQLDLGTKIVHLISGQDLLAKTFYDEDAKQYTLESPLSPFVRQDPASGSLQVQLIPVRPYADENTKTLTLDKAHVIYVLDPAPQMKETYQRATSNIVIPTMGKVPTLDTPISQLLK